MRGAKGSSQWLLPLDLALSSSPFQNCQKLGKKPQFTELTIGLFENRTHQTFGGNMKSLKLLPWALIVFFTLAGAHASASLNLLYNNMLSFPQMPTFTKVGQIQESPSRRARAEDGPLLWKWCRHADSNCGPTLYESVALPPELCRHACEWITD